MSKAIDKQSITGAIRSKHRLSEISHHFLSDENERLPAWKNTSTIPILLGSKHDDYIVYELNRAFNQQKSTCMVLNIENRAPTSGMLSIFPETIPSATSPKDDHEDMTMPELCLVPVTSPPTTLALQSDRFIIAVHASLSGVRIAYDQLAFMASLDTDFKVCVIMLEAKSIRDAKRFFGFLCDSAQSLLSLELECGGFLLRGDHTISDANSVDENSAQTEYTHDSTVATDLDGVAECILLKFAPKATRTLPTSLSAPAGPAGLLS